MHPILFSVAMAAFLAAPAVAQDHAHEHEHPVAAALSPAQAPAQRYATDAPLRENMQGIRTAVDELGHFEMGHMGPEQAAQLGGQIADHVRGIIANCKLPPDADAALHTIIAPLMQQAQALQADPTDVAPVAAMRAAVADYSRLFDDPAAAAD